MAKCRALYMSDSLSMFLTSKNALIYNIKHNTGKKVYLKDIPPPHHAAVMVK